MSRPTSTVKKQIAGFNIAEDVLKDLREYCDTYGFILSVFVEKAIQKELEAKREMELLYTVNSDKGYF